MTSSQHGLLRRAQFLLERWVQRGVVAQLILMTDLVAVVAVLGGIAAWALTADFDSVPTAIWWAFLRLTDPGYLGDDEGVTLRVVSTAVTVLGYVLFMGSLIAIMTQWLARTIRNLESGLTPIAMQNHFVILGWTNRTSEIIKKLLTAGGRLERFFAQRNGSEKLRIVILAEHVDAERRLQLRDDLGADWKENQIFLRSGSSLQREHLARLDLTRAAVVIIPGADFELGGSELNDTRVVKTLLNVDALFADSPGDNVPCVVAELFDPRKVSVARNSIHTRSEIIAGDRLVSRLLSQSLRHSGVGTVLLSLLTHREGNGLYLRSFDELAGKSTRDLIDVFPEAVVLGVVSGHETPTVHLDPKSDVILAQGDRLILLSERYSKCEPSGNSTAHVPPPVTRQLPPQPMLERRRILVLGWSYKIATLLTELLEADDGRFDVTIMSRVSEGKRARVLAHIPVSERLAISHVVGDYSLEQDLGKVELTAFDDILFLASGWLATSEEADARTVLGLVLLRSLLEGHENPPEVLAELLDPDSARILGSAADVVFVSPRMLSHLLAHVGLLPELNAVFDALICSGGTEVVLRTAADLDLDPQGVTFAGVQHAAAAAGCVALGLYVRTEHTPERQIALNPDRTQRWTLARDDLVVLLSCDGT